MSSGDGWTRCGLGHRHWGLFGAAGLLLVADEPSAVLLQLRAAWSHHGGTWGLPGGARHAGESAQDAALRECAEEVAVDLTRVSVVAERTDEHGGWSYTTVVARTGRCLPLQPSGGESDAVAWVALDEVAAHDLHPGLRATWPTLAAQLPGIPPTPAVPPPG